jgi:hypothetical protein
MPDDGKLKVKDTVPHVEKKTTVNVQKVSSPPATSPNPQGQGGVSKSQWTVIGLLLILLVLELVIHPTFQQNVLDFLKAFNPPKQAQTTATTSTTKSQQGSTVNL